MVLTAFLARQRYCRHTKLRLTEPYSGQKNIIIATGARPTIPSIQGLEKVEFLTSDNLWNIRELPKSLLVVGGGPIGSELTQCFARLGSHVTQVETLSSILAREDDEISQASPSTIQPRRR